MVGEPIGRGGKGFVFAAVDLRTKGPVALKIVIDAKAKDAAWRLEHEARLVASLRHPNICSLLDLGDLPGIGPYMVMERLYGETVAHRISSGSPLPFTEALDLMRQVLSALEAAHGANVVHRDIKPNNIFITGREGMPPIAKVLDFGCARKLGGDRITRPGVLVGTPAYMPAEAIRGDEFVQRGDLFSCAATLFEMLAGVLPFAGKTTTMVQRAVLANDRRWLLDYRPEAPRALADLIHRSLSADVGERPASAREMHRELQRLSKYPPKLELVKEEEETERTTRIGLFGLDKGHPRQSSINDLRRSPPRPRKVPSSTG
jgi:serine/threonine-protein kinase